MVALSYVASLILAAEFPTKACDARYASCCAPITQSVNRDPRQGYFLDPRRVTLAFAQTEVKDPMGGRSRAELMPRLTVEFSATPMIEEARKQAERGIRQEVPGDFDVPWVRFHAPYLRGGRLVMTGDFKMERWAWTWGVCLDGWKLRKCQWKTRVWERTTGFTLTLSASGVGELAFSGASAGAVGTRSPIERGAAIGLDGAAEVSTDLNWMEKSVEVVVNIEIFSAVPLAAALDLRLDLADLLRDLRYSRALENLQPMDFLATDIARFGHESRIRSLGAKPWETADAWDSFTGAFEFDPHQSGLRARDGEFLYEAAFGFDLKRYLELNYVTRDGGTGGDILQARRCDMTRPLFESFIKKIGEPVKAPESTPAVDAQALSTPKLEAYYGLRGLEEFYRSKPGKPERLLTPIEIAETRGITPATGNLTTLARTQGWSRAEFACAKKIAARRSGSPDKIFPAQVFESCVTGEERQQFLVALVQRVESHTPRGQWSKVAAVSPVAPAAILRGWHYCQQTPQLCGGNRVMWSQAASLFGKGSGAEHHGVDLIDVDAAVNEDIEIQAIAKGSLTFVGRNPLMWGHALALPFQTQDGKAHLAIYANLPAEAASMDGQLVEPEQSMGRAACSGEAAGQGNGRCNNACNIGLFNASDLHLHFEVWDVSAEVPQAVQPLSVVSVGSSVDEVLSDQKQLYACQ